MYCNSTSITFKNMTCKLKLTSRNSTSLTFGAFIMTDITELMVVYIRNLSKKLFYQSFTFQGVFTWSYKEHRNWRQILKTPQIELCHFMGSENMYHQFYKTYLDGIFEQLPGLPRRCPIKAGPCYTYDAPIIDLYAKNPNNQNGYMKDMVGLPNGNYKLTVELFTTADPQAIFIEYQYEINRRMNAENF
jgi:hypothetical protein